MLIKRYFKLFKPHNRIDGAVYASTRFRFFAIILDLLLLAFVMQAIFVVTHYVYKPMSPPIAIIDKRKMDIPITQEEKQIIIDYVKNYIIFNIIQCIMALFYFFTMCFKFGQTPGKMIFRIKVVDDNTLGRITLKQCIKRIMFSVISVIACCFGIIWIWFSKKNQTWHDIAAGTVVVCVDKNKNIVKNDDLKNIEKYDSMMLLVKDMVIFYRMLIEKILIYIIKKLKFF